MKYHFKIHKEGSGFWTECLELPGCITQGDTKEELYKNIQEALNLYLEEPNNSKELIPLPNASIKKARNIIAVAVDPQIAFASMVRYHRLKNGLTQKQAAAKMELDSLYSYQRLEHKRCNPSLKIISKLTTVFPEFSIDFTLSR